MSDDESKSKDRDRAFTTYEYAAAGNKEAAQKEIDERAEVTKGTKYEAG
mgnify:CR=1 FL=1